MPAMTKALYARGQEYAFDCLQAGVPDVTPLTNWINSQARGIAAPIAGKAATSGAAANTIGPAIFDQAVLAAVQSSPNGVGMVDLRPILKQYGKQSNQITAALNRLQKKKLLTKTADGLWRAKGTRAKIDKSLGTRRQSRRGATAVRATTGGNAAANGGQQQAATG